MIFERAVGGRLEGPNRIVVAKVDAVSSVGHGNNYDSLFLMSCLPQFVLI